MRQATTSLLDSWNMLTVEIDGREVCNEEAAMIWETMSNDTQAAFSGLTELQVIESIYALFFDYRFTNTHGVQLSKAQINQVINL